MSQTGELNYLWASLIIEELVRNGVEYFCIAPGSRSTPLTVAAAENKHARTFVHFDERGLAFHALGYASAKGGGVAIITTSGTAVANLFPAVIEASKKKVPLVLLTADRPPELRQTGANQTIDQVKIFGEYVRWQTDFPTPTEAIQKEFILTTIDQAVFHSKGELPGPVHLNCMFREPFLPERLPVTLPNLWKNKKVFTQYVKGDAALTDDKIRMISERIHSISKGVLAVGKLRSVEEEQAVLKLADQLQWPIFADITSGLRWGHHHPFICSHFDQLLKERPPDVDGLIQLGGRMTSKAFYQWLEQQEFKEYMMVLNHPLRNDPTHQVTTRVQAGVQEFCAKLTCTGTAWAADLFEENKHIRNANAAYFKNQTRLTEASIAYTLSTEFPKDHALFLSNSLPIREMDRFADGGKQRVALSANRGASGIDGIISSAIGYSQGLDQPVVLLVGDLAFLYDLNALAMLEQARHPLTIIVVNNNGGGIFNFLPVAQYDAVFEPFFAMPHNLSVEHAARMFKLHYQNPETNAEFRQTIQQVGTSTIVELHVSREQTVDEYQNTLKQERIS